MKTNRLVIFTGILLMLSLPAQAHTGAGAVHGFGDGLLHPLMGVDHVLVMLAIGLWAALRGGRALWLLPVSFLLMMAAGAGLWLAGVGKLSHCLWTGGCFGRRICSKPRLCSCRRTANWSRCQHIRFGFSINDRITACFGHSCGLIGNCQSKNHQRRIWFTLCSSWHGLAGWTLSGCLQT
jgi:hypothetical protein